MDRALGKHVIYDELVKYSNNNPSNIELQIIRLDDIFTDSTKDRVWLKKAGEKGWLVITKDKRIRHRKAEFEMVIKHKVKMFTLTSGNLTGDEMAEVIIKAIPKIHKFLQKNLPPFIATIAKSGSIKLIEIT